MVALRLHCCTDFSLVVVSRGYSPVQCEGFLLQVLLLLRSTGSKTCKLQLLLRENSKWRMTPVLRDGPEVPEAPEAPGSPEREAAEASAEGSVVVSAAGVGAGVGAGAEAAELAEARPRTRSGSRLPSWAAWSRT